MAFLTIMSEGNGHLGGLLITNQWGRPLEFRVSTAVQPNRVQQILYGSSLVPFICADLIGKTLLEKSSTQADLIVTDSFGALDLRRSVDAPVVWHNLQLETPAGDELGPAVIDKLHCHRCFPQDVETVRAMFESAGNNVDLTEPFTRIREAVGEARKMGVTSRG